MKHRVFYYLSDCIRRHFVEHRVFYLLSCMSVVLGVALGLARAVGIRTAVGVDLIKIDYISNLLRGKSSAGAFLFIHFFYNILFVALIFVCAFWIYTLPLACVVLLYRGYLIGLNIFVIANVLGGGGAVVVWLIFFPLELIAMFFICSHAAVFGERCVHIHRFGRCSQNGLQFLVSKAGIFFLLLFLTTFLSFIFIAIFNSALIIIV